MAASITKNFNMGDEIFYIDNNALASGVISRITTNTVGVATEIHYYVAEHPNPVEESLAFATAQLAVNDLAARVLAEFQPEPEP